MLRALASYFFGGIEDETPEAPIECETREVNDWLVVNLPDQNRDSINLNEDDDTYEIDDEDIRNEMDEDDTVEVDASDTYEMDSDEDDILLSVSFLMMPPDGEKLISELSNDQYRFESRVSEQHTDLFPILSPPSYWKYFCEGTDSRQLMNTERTSKQILDLIFPVQPAIQRPAKINDDHAEALLDLIIGSRIQKRAQRNEIVNEFEGVHVHVIDLTPPPMYSKSYVNHRHPEKLLNYDILQRIKELEPEQQAVQRSAKKTLTRGQLNRQNKNYMYETSSKRNRRSNRQRNHSGANNNRKC
ncbi:hypothetical protein AVEN_65672-1 [Araneus ventricosus]|uniref:Uncharacterized protein n=1 Tax=Araneus ventricosus TaxID=182803 RepID=A0A4Y2HIK8_ARAVE|nr:hypothetical protein AVEN_65672-1 [Araneus ventricosus]